MFDYDFYDPSWWFIIIDIFCPNQWVIIVDHMALVNKL